MYPRCNNGADLFIHLAGAGYLGAVKFLYDNGFCTSESVGEAFASTMTPNYTAVANFLLDTDLVSAAALARPLKEQPLRDGLIQWSSYSARDVPHHNWSTKSLEK